MGREWARRSRHRLLPPVGESLDDSTDESRDPTFDEPPSGGLIRAAVIHLLNEQPVVADLYGYPNPSDTILICTNVRGSTGKRPVWADDQAATFYFPWTQIRFLEIPPARMHAVGGEDPGTAIALRGPVEDPDLEIDEDFLRRVRDV